MPMNRIAVAAPQRLIRRCAAQRRVFLFFRDGNR
jgi:hypothetical protein